MKNTCSVIDNEICEKTDNEIEKIRTVLGTKSKSEILNENAIENSYCANGNSVICNIVKTVGLELICHHDCEHVCSNLYKKHDLVKNRNTTWNNPIIYEDYHIYYNINEIVYITTTANGHIMPRVVECTVTGISIPKTRKLQPIYHIVSSGKDRGYEEYNTNIKHETSKNKIFSTREMAEKAIVSCNKIIPEKRKGRTIKFISPNFQKLILNINDERIPFLIKRIRFDKRLRPTYELHRYFAAKEQEENHINGTVSVYSILKLREEEIKDRLYGTQDMIF